jgi:hypothetical protein
MAFTRCTQPTFYESRATPAASRRFLPDRIFTDPAPGDRQPDTNHVVWIHQGQQSRETARSAEHRADWLYRNDLKQPGIPGMNP